MAKEAIQEASRNGSDVVLVDTAGRMQVLFLLFMCILIFCYSLVNVKRCLYAS